MRIRQWSGALAALFLVAGVALSAHLKVEKTFPETDATVTSIPDHLQVWFSQAPTVPVSSFTLEGPDGKVTMGKPVAGKLEGKADKSIVAPITGTITAGKYTATWKTSGSDGHIQTGTFDFIVKPGV